MNRPAYFIIDVAIHDPEGMRPYQAQVEQTLLAYGGKRLVLGGAPDAIEGEAPRGRIVVVQFPSMQHAHAWHDSPAYQAIIGYRHAAATSTAYVVEGLSPLTEDQA